MNYGLSGLFVVGALASSAFAQQELLKLAASDGAAVDQFGNGVSISGDRAVVGAFGNDDVGSNSGSAYIFDVTTGQELFKLTASDETAGDEFGASVSISGDRAIVGADRDDDNGVGSGSAYVFNVTTGQELHKLIPSDGAALDCFGVSVSISGGRAIVGAYFDDDNGSNSGSAYVFDVATGQELFKLTASDGAANDNFGVSVSISGDRAIVGANRDDDNGHDSGSAYVFDVTTGQALYKLTASDGAVDDEFGNGVSISGDRAICGAMLDDDNGFASGSAYIFDVTTGQELFKLTASDGANGDRFGVSVAISGDRAIGGAELDGDNGNNSGSAYVFDVTTGRELYKLTASDGAVGDNFASSVAISGDRAIGGSVFGDGLVAGSGSAYVFSTPAQGSAYCFGDGGGTPCTCANPGAAGEGCANFSGSGGLLTAGGSNDVTADDLVFYASNLLPSQPALLFVGLNAINGGNGVQFGDGLRCAGGSVVRLGVQVPDANGNATWGPGLGAQGGWGAGVVRRFQGWYRDPAGPCGSGFNLTNGVEVTFTP